MTILAQYNTLHILRFCTTRSYSYNDYTCTVTPYIYSIYLTVHCSIVVINNIFSSWNLEDLYISHQGCTCVSHHGYPTHPLRGSGHDKRMSDVTRPAHQNHHPKCFEWVCTVLTAHNSISTSVPFDGYVRTATFYIQILLRVLALVYIYTYREHWPVEQFL